MSFQPVIPIGGIAGWRFLERTRDSQFDTFTQGAQLKRDAEYFAENIGSIASAEDLIKDRRLLNVALGAFGLQDDINNKAFIQKILEDGTVADDALANRLADDRYKKLSEAFGFGPSELMATGDSTAMADIVDRFKIQEFETAVGNQNESMRIAMYAGREIAEIAGDDMSENAKWFTLLGQAPLKKFFETAMGLPSAVGQLDLDRQLEIYKDKTLSLTGSSDVSQFTDPEVLEDLTIRYLARAQIEEFNASFNPAANALFLLQSANGF